MAAPVWQSVETARTSGNATSLAVNKPASVASGDLLLTTLHFQTAPGTITPPTGWIAIRATTNSGTEVHSYYRVADGTEGASFTWSWVNTGRAVITCNRITGVDQTTPINIDGGGTGSSSSIVCPSVTTTVDDCLLIATSSQSSIGTHTAPAGMTERWDLTGHSGLANASPATSGHTEALGAAGATGTRTITSTANAAYAAQSIAVAPETEQTISATGIASAEAFGSPTLTPGSVTITPSGVG